MSVHLIFSPCHLWLRTDSPAFTRETWKNYYTIHQEHHSFTTHPEHNFTLPVQLRKLIQQLRNILRIPRHRSFPEQYCKLPHSFNSSRTAFVWTTKAHFFFYILLHLSLHDTPIFLYMDSDTNTVFPQLLRKPLLRMNFLISKCLFEFHYCGTASTKCKQEFMKGLSEALEFKVYINIIHSLLWSI